MTRKRITTTTTTTPATTPKRMGDGLRGTTRPGVGEAGLNLEGQRRSNNFIDVGYAPNPNRRRVNIETRPRAPLAVRSPGTVMGRTVGRRVARRTQTP